MKKILKEKTFYVLLNFHSIPGYIFSETFKVNAKEKHEAIAKAIKLYKKELGVLLVNEVFTVAHVDF
jgi:hypothetical protein